MCYSSETLGDEQQYIGESLYNVNNCVEKLIDLKP